MSPTYEQAIVLAKLTLESWPNTGFRRVTPQDRVTAEGIDLCVHEDGDDWVFRTHDKLPVLEGMGS